MISQATLSFSAVLLALVLTSTCCTAHQCIHDSEPIQQLLRADAGKRARVQYRAFHAQSAQNMRIRVLTPDLDDPERHCTAVGQTRPTFQGSDTFVCRDVDILTAAKKSILVDNVLPAAVAKLQAALQMTPVAGNLFVPHGACSPFSVPASHRVGATGIADADFAIYIAAAQTPTNVLGWAGACATDQGGRPFIGRANFGPEYIEWDAEDPRVGQRQINTAVHEILHALGFSSSFFPSSHRASVALRGKTATVYTISPVLEEFRSQIGCTTSVGAELEDEGGSGSAGSHWDKRVLRDEIMAASGGKYLTRMTLAAMEARGWYSANYAVAEPHAWGKDAGCGFQTEKCDTAAGGRDEYFCFTQDQQDCTFDRKAIGGCSIQTWGSDLPPHFQYFDNPRLGGHRFIDHCPEIFGFSNRDCEANIQPTENDEIFGYWYGPKGRCMHTVLGQQLIKSNYNHQGDSLQRCLRVRCPCPGNRLQFRIGETHWIDCPLDGSAGTATVPSSTGWHGAIVCPPAAEMCDSDITEECPTTATTEDVTTTTTEDVTTATTEDVTTATTEDVTTTTTEDVTTASTEDVTTTTTEDVTTATTEDVTTATTEDVTTTTTEDVTTASTEDVTTTTTEDVTTTTTEDVTTATTEDVTTASTEDVTTATTEGNTTSAADEEATSGESSATASSPPSPTPRPSSLRRRTYVIRLGGSGWEAVLQQSRATIVAAVRVDIAQRLEVSSSRITILTLSLGSLITEFELTSDDATEPQLAVPSEVSARLQVAEFRASQEVYEGATGSAPTEVVPLGVVFTNEVVVDDDPTPPETTNEPTSDSFSCSQGCMVAAIIGVAVFLGLVGSAIFAVRRCTHRGRSRPIHEPIA